MQIATTLTLSAGEQEQLAGILGCTIDALEGELSRYAGAAVEEYARMFLGQRVFTRGSDILEYRLFLLVKTAFNERLPDEQRVSALFQTSSTGSRALLRSVMSKYQYELRPEIAKTLRETLESATADEDDFIVTLNSENVVDAMNRILGSIDGTLPQVVKKRGTVASYTVRASSYAKLCDYCDAEPIQAAE